MRRIFLIFSVIILVIGGYFYFNAKGSYNKMVQLEENVEAQWGQVQNVYQRRADLIPNIVETVKGYKEFEQETLTQVADARAKVGQLTVTPEVLSNPKLMERFNQAQGELGNTLSRLLSVSEKYPDLKANQSFNALITELEGTENRISVERKKFNDRAKEFNSYVRQFPTNLYANAFGFERVEYFESAPSAQNAPKVEF